MIKVKFIVVILSLLTFSCEKQKKFPYSSGLNEYLSIAYNEDLTRIEKETLVFLYLEYCKSCITDALNLLTNLEDNKLSVKLYLIGKEDFYPENLTLIQDLKNRFPYKTDPNTLHYSYATGINEPLVVGVEEGEIVDFIHINKDTILLSTEMLSK
ncbi:hypothetical protein [Roseivirga pacifica]|uniref:hypothetical protein n=1 Tax=Roseivirga pacifica TaxID=1267423 RepID=UPI003BB023CF